MVIKEPLPAKQVETKVDEGTQLFLFTDPVLAAKLLCLEGLRGLTAGGSGADPAGLTAEQRQQRADWRDTRDYLDGVEQTLTEILDGHPNQQAVIEKVVLWRNGYPPLADEFNDSDHLVVEQFAPTSPFVSLASEFIPRFAESEPQ